MEHTYQHFIAHGREHIVRAEDGAFVPRDEANCDYMKYLKWCETNTPAIVVAEQGDSNVE